MTLILTVEFNDQLSATNKPLESLGQGQGILAEEVKWENTVQAYIWDADTREVLEAEAGDFHPYKLHARNINIDALGDGL